MGILRYFATGVILCIHRLTNELKIIVGNHSKEKKSTNLIEHIRNTIVGSKVITILNRELYKAIFVHNYIYLLYFNKRTVYIMHLNF